MIARTFPVFQPVSERALLVEFGDQIDAATHAKVLHLDRILTVNAPAWFIEAVPAYASILVCFDPTTCDHWTVRQHIQRWLRRGQTRLAPTKTREIAVCYDDDLAPDLAEVAQRLGSTPEQVITQHLAAAYQVFMYGFAPGYAYLAGVPGAIQLPRKPTAIRDVPAGSVIIAGAQCLITTLTMPTGWWIIGRSPARILPREGTESFLFDVGDQVRFRRIGRREFNPMAPT